MGKPQWLRTDESEDVLVSLSACLTCVTASVHELGLWKWAILALHNALQGAMVCHLSGTAQLGALSEKSSRAWLEWHDRDRKGEIKRIYLGTDEMGLPQHRFATGHEPPPEHLADAKELLKRLSNESKRIKLGAGGVIAITESEKTSFLRLHALRNDLSHFTPKGWSIEVNGMPAMFLDVLAIIEKIASDAWPFRHMELADIAKRDNLIGELRAELMAKKAQYENE